MPEGYQWEPLISWGDPLFSGAKPFDEYARGAYQDLSFGDNNDGMEIFEINGKTVLVVNNEYVNVDIMFPDGIRSNEDIFAVQNALWGKRC